MRVAVGMSANNGNSGLPARFKQALQETEKTRDAAHVASLFADGATLTNLGGEHGADPRAFWQTYVEQFSDIRSEFTGEIISENGAALEWQSHGTTAEGKPVEYRGVSLIEFDQEAVTGFRTYYDSAVFVRNQ